MDKHLKVTFLPEGREIYCLPGTVVMEAAGRADITLNSDCGGRGVCGKCRVRFLRGAPPPGEREKKVLKKEELEDNFRLACQARVEEEAEIEIPLGSRFFARKILIGGKGEIKTTEPTIHQLTPKLEKPSLKNQVSDDEILRKGMGIRGLRIPLEFLRELPDILRENHFQVRAILDDSELIDLESASIPFRSYGIAVDIGTTTLVGSLLDLNRGRELAVSSRLNPQVTCGADVISRITYIGEKKEGLRELHEAIIEAINNMIRELIKKAGVERKKIYRMTVAGNSAMQHIFLRLSPVNLGVIPFSPVVKEPVEVKAKELGLEILPRAHVYVFPTIAGFVGGDTIALILATRLHKSREVKLAVDVGTNGEVVLGNRERLVAASTAAGPAFEGARISRGMPATSGAVEKVIMGEEVIYNTIGNLPPIGICGSGLLDAVAGLLERGIVDGTGRVLPREKVDKNIPSSLLSRILKGEKGNDFLLVKSGETGDKKPLLLTQRDIREFQLAKGAIFAGIQILKRMMNLKDKQIGEILLAGAFGNYLRKENAVKVGLIPPLALEKIIYVGNTSLSGAKLALLSRKMAREAEKISRQVEYVELTLQESFQTEFASSLLFPS